MTDDMESYHLPEHKLMLWCPSCNVDLTFCKAEIKGRDAGVRPPKHGDNSVCFECLAYLTYVEFEPGQLRLDELNEKAFGALKEQTQIGLMRVRSELLARKGSASAPQPSPYEKLLMAELTALRARVSVLEERGPACACCYCAAGDGLNCMHRRNA